MEQSTLSRTTKLRKFSFTPNFKLLLLKIVREYDAQKAAHGTKDKVFKDVLQSFTDQFPQSTWIHHQQTTVKTLRDKLRSMMEVTKKVNNLNERSSGITENSNETDLLLDDLIHEKEEKDEHVKACNAKLSARDHKLKEAGETIQSLAAERS